MTMLNLSLADLASKFAGVRWNASHDAFVFPCPNHPDRLAIATAEGLKCAGGCSQDQILAHTAVLSSPSNGTPKPSQSSSNGSHGASQASTKPSSKLAYAVAYARRGMAVFPLHNIESDRECSCGKLQCSSAGKHPRLNDWQTLATRDEAQIAAWWKQWPDANVGVKCGRDSDLTVLDVDGDVGRETLRDLEMENGELPETAIAITSSGGAHFYFKFEEGVGNAVRFAPGLDIRTEGGLVVGVGSVTKRRYIWEEAFRLGELAPAKMPVWLLEQIKASGNKSQTANGGKVTVPAVETMIEGSGRHNRMWQLGRSLRAQRFPDEARVAALRETNNKFATPMAGGELEPLIHDILTQPDRPAFQSQDLLTSPAPNERQLKPLPAPMKAGEWFVQETERFANTSYIWDGVLEAGAYAMVGGKKGHGKSTFIRTLAFKISRGEEFMGRPTVRSKVWYLDFEPGGRGRIDTLKKLGWCDDDWLEFSTIPPPVNHPNVFDWLRKYIVEREFKVIIVDTLFKLLRIDGANDYDKALYAQIPLEEICRELGVCFIVLHHARKNGQFSSQQSCAEQMLGATSIAGAACACILINHRVEKYTFRMDPPRYGTAIENELVLQLDTLGFVAESGTWKKLWVGQTKDIVMAAAKEAEVDEEGWFVPAALRQVVDPEKGPPLKRSSLYWALDALVKDQLLEKGKSLKAGGRGKPVTPYRLNVGFSGAEATPPKPPLTGANKDLFPRVGNKKNEWFDDKSREDPNGIDWSK
jgi:hypothetical protein